MQFLPKKLNYYGVRGKANNWFSSHLKNRAQFVTTNGFNSDLKKLWCHPRANIRAIVISYIH